MEGPPKDDIGGVSRWRAISRLKLLPCHLFPIPFLDPAASFLNATADDCKLGSSSLDTVRGVFPEGGPLFKGSEISEKTHIQIAVRNTDNILVYFWPRNAES
jgi:hypothetical protein